jgi:hypothetical protein
MYEVISREIEVGSRKTEIGISNYTIKRINDNLDVSIEKREDSFY